MNDTTNTFTNLRALLKDSYSKKTTGKKSLKIKKDSTKKDK